MLVKFDENLSPEYYLTNEESEALEENGYVFIEEEGICIVKTAFEYYVCKVTDDYTSLQLNSRLANQEKEKEENELSKQ